ncbi:MAG: hypothetical protein FWG07_12005 [Treponema sp.]|nr:hypothetical protein [Treponema sp.]
MKKYIGISIIVCILLALPVNLGAQENPASVSRAVEYSISDSVDNIGNLYIKAWSELPSVLTFVNSDGSVTVCTSDEKEKITYIYEFNANLEEQKELQFKNEFNQLGAFTRDDEGNYYFFYASRAANQNTENMAIAKYSREGEKIKIYRLIAGAPNSFGSIKIPFDAGTCRLELSGSMLTVYFARERFDGHQASYGFVLDKDTFERIDKGYAYYYTNGTYPKGNNLLPFTGHSFNQFVLPVDGGFVYADHGDAYPRAFTFGKFVDGSNTIRLNAFAFPGAKGSNPTYAEMGGLAKTQAGYIFAGTYGKDRNNARNLFVLTFDEELKKCSAPIYLTKYTKNDGHAGHPKIVALDSGRYLLLWELFKFSTQSANSIVSQRTEYLSTWMLVIDEQGNAISEIQELKGIRLNINDTLRYNPRNGKVYWAINDRIAIFDINGVVSVYSSTFTVYALNVNK